MNLPRIAVDRTPRDPCNPSPCGPYSQCRNINDQGVCSCLPDYRGSPPSCRPECVVNSECPTNQACVNQKCMDLCPGPCGLNAICRVVNHSPICACQDDYTGDPFSRCFLNPKRKKIKLNYPLKSIYPYFTLSCKERKIIN